MVQAKRVRELLDEFDNLKRLNADLAERVFKQSDLLSKRAEKPPEIEKAIEIGIRYGQIDGDHHRLWVIDQMLRVLLGEKYDETIKEANGTEYDWDVGIPP